MKCDCSKVDKYNTFFVVIVVAVVVYSHQELKTTECDSKATGECEFDHFAGC